MFVQYLNKAQHSVHALPIGEAVQAEDTQEVSETIRSALSTEDEGRIALKSPQTLA
jgi:hypothetical protein